LCLSLFVAGFLGCLVLLVVRVVRFVRNGKANVLCKMLRNAVVLTSRRQTTAAADNAKQTTMTTAAAKHHGRQDNANGQLEGGQREGKQTRRRTTLDNRRSKNKPEGGQTCVRRTTFHLGPTSAKIRFPSSGNTSFRKQRK